MKKIIAFIMVCIFPLHVVPVFAADISERYIYISPNEALFRVKKTDEKAVNIGFRAPASFIDAEGTMYVIFDALAYLTANEDVDFLYDPESGVGQTQYKYPQYTPEKWFDVTLYQDANTFLYDGEQKTMKKAPVEVQGVLYFPLREMLVALGFDEEAIEYCPENQSVYVEQRPTVSELIKYDNTVNLAVEEDIFYEKDTNDFSQLEDYFKTHVHEDFDIDDFLVEEEPLDFGFFKDKEVNQIRLYYMVDDLRTDFAYFITTENSKVVNVTQIGNNLIGVRDNIEWMLDRMEGHFLDEETLFQMAREEAGDRVNIAEQRTYRYFDSKLERIVYGVDNVCGSERSGYSASTSYFVENRCDLYSSFF